MIKFYHKLLIILTTITVVSFLILGFIVHNSIYTKTVEYEKKSLLKDAEQILAFYKAGNNQHIQELANHYHSNIKIIESDQTTEYKGERKLSIAERQDSLLRQLNTRN